MKLRKFLAVLLVLVLMLAGCDAAEMIDDSAIRADAVVLLESFVNDDYDACRAVVNAYVTDEDLEAFFPAIAAELKDLGAYEMTAVGWNKKMSNGETLTSVQYLISGESGKYYLNVYVEEGMEGIAGMQISSAEEDAAPTTPAGPVHYVFTAVGLAVLGFVAWMVIDCALRKMKRKWLWIILILMGCLLLTFTMQDGSVNFKFNIGLYLGVTSLTTFAAGGFKVQLYIPIAAIVYFFKRKELTAKEEPAVQIVEEAE